MSNLLGVASRVGALWLSAAVAAGAARSGAQAEADLDGDGSVETVRAEARRGEVRLEVRDAHGKKLSRAKAPSPSGTAAAVALETAPLGSAGALVESVASDGESECRSLWRLRATSLERLPVLRGGDRALPDCDRAQEWSYRWERPEADRPARYVRERTRAVEQGTLREVEVFAFAGFRLEVEPQASASEINGVTIPEWYPAVLYTQAALEGLYERFDLSGFRTEPRLEVETKRSAGVFAVRWSDGAGSLRLPVTSLVPDPNSRELTLGAGSGSQSGSVKLLLDRTGRVATEARVAGLGARFDRRYVPASRLEGGALQVFASAADELASGSLPGNWQTEGGETVSVRLVSGPPYRLRFGDADVGLEIDGAPEGTDLLLAPADGSPPRWAVLLRGPDAMARLPVACAAPREGKPRDCRIAGGPESLRRLGSRLNVGG